MRTAAVRAERSVPAFIPPQLCHGGNEGWPLLEETAMGKQAMMTGRVTKVLREKGFGFLKADEGGDEYFFHRSAVQQFETLAEGARVQFVATQASKGPRAESVELIDE